MLTHDKSDIFHASVRAWYYHHGRTSLPWRNTTNPYHIWVSEVMLQQTQVETVLQRYYQPFLVQFPTIQALAKVEQEEVLKTWQGLGYYSRAVNLHNAAKLCTQLYDGQLPTMTELLIQLPGIGRNTAHAIAAFAYHQPVPVMEANLKRVLSRIFALKQPTEKQLWETAYSLLDTAHPFDYNQAMMDVGATVCTKRNPACLQCPAAGICQGKSSPEAYPAAKPKKATKVHTRIIIVVQQPDGRIYASPRTSRFLHGMYQFVEIPESTAKFMLMGDEYTLDCASPIGCIRQVYSHFTLEAEVYIYRLNSPLAGNQWYTPEALALLPHSKAEEKILALLS